MCPVQRDWPGRYVHDFNPRWLGRVGYREIKIEEEMQAYGIYQAAAVSSKSSVEQAAQEEKAKP